VGVVYIDKIEADHPLPRYSRIGRRAPLHCTALGKSLAEWEAEEWLDRFLRQRLRAYTPSTLVHPADVRHWPIDGPSAAPGLAGAESAGAASTALGGEVPV